MAVVTDSWLADTLLLVIALLTLLYRYLNSNSNYFRERGIPCLSQNPVLAMSSTKNLFSITNIRNLYTRFEGERFFGMFITKVPILVIRDPNLVQRIMVKDFAHFHDHPSCTSETDFASQNLFNLRGRKWRILRQKITPTFSTGKLKQMFEEINKCGDNILEEVSKVSLSGESVDARLFTSSFTTEVIGSTTFGLDLSKSNPQADEFNRMIRDMFGTSFRQGMVFIISALAPKILNLLRITAFPKHAIDYFVNLTRSTKAYRKQNDIKRNDYFQLLLSIQEQEESGKSLLPDDTEEDNLVNQMEYAPDHDHHPETSNKTLLTDELLTAQAIIFLTAGSESVSGTLSFVLYHLGKDMTMQERLAEEVDKALGRHGGCTYQAIKEMTYLDQIIQEAQRMYPVNPIVSRECTTPYHIPDSDIILDKGTNVIIPLTCLQMDSKYYPSPELFNPDRFENNNFKPNSTFLPFGDGPRICIALRFAILEMKVCISKIISQYSVSVSSKTKEPFVLDETSFFPRPEGGIWVNFKKRPNKPSN